MTNPPIWVEEKENNMVCTNPMVMQVQKMKGAKGNYIGFQELSRQVKGMKRELEVLNPQLNALDESFKTLSNFSLKFTHGATIAFQLLQ